MMTFSIQQQVIESNDLKIRSLLRDATHHLHVQLNRQSVITGLTLAQFPLENYQKLLLAYYHLYQILEGRIVKSIELQACGFDYSHRAKLPWLKADLDFFRLTPGDLKNTPLIEISAPDIANLGHFIGILYVTEGSTLGGQLISRNLAEHHGLTLNAGARFFNGYGELTSTMWHESMGFAESIAGDDSLCCSAVEAALQTFRLFQNTLDAYFPNATQNAVIANE